MILRKLSKALWRACSQQSC